jgi:hypothetical protein
MTPYLKNNQSEKRAEHVAEVVEHLPTKHKVLRSNPRTAKRKKISEQEILVFLFEGSKEVHLL